MTDKHDRHLVAALAWVIWESWIENLKLKTKVMIQVISSSIFGLLNACTQTRWTVTVTAIVDEHSVMAAWSHD